jgi:hypothetical protein
LVEAFESENPLEHSIFEFCSNLNSKGIDKLFAAYDIGIKRLQTIVNQEILLTEPHTTVGRRDRNVTRVTVAEISKMRKEKESERREDRGEDRREEERSRGRPRGRPRGSKK